jgi:hypothetical protein
MTKEKIYIGIDDEVIEATGEVLDNLLAEIKDNKAKEAAAIKAAADKAATKAAIAERLGLTPDELTALIS